MHIRSLLACKENKVVSQMSAYYWQVSQEYDSAVRAFFYAKEYSVISSGIVSNCMRMSTPNVFGYNLPHL